MVHISRRMALALTGGSVVLLALGINTILNRQEGLFAKSICGDAKCTKGEKKRCPRDCLCGNGKCESKKGETWYSCPQDCPNLCGDGKCDNGETLLNCPDCPNVCGDGFCGAPGETPWSCPRDCDCNGGYCD